MSKDYRLKKYCRMGMLPFVALAVPALVFALSLTPLYGGTQNGGSKAMTVSQGATASAGFMLAAVAPSKIKHEITDRKDCLKCHNPEAGEKPAPKNHVGRKNESCMLCHKPAAK